MSKYQEVMENPTAAKIVDVATELFYQNGYRATGINEVIKQSGVAKATFYHHFPTKDDLCAVYLEGVRVKEFAGVDAAIDKAKGPLKRFMAVIETLGPWLEHTNYRGCAFLHMVSEEPDAKSPLRVEGELLYNGIRQRIQSVTKGLLESDPDKYGHLNEKRLVEEYLLAFSGAIALGEIYRQSWPVDNARNLLRRLIS